MIFLVPGLMSNGQKEVEVAVTEVTEIVETEITEVTEVVTEMSCVAMLVVNQDTLHVTASMIERNAIPEEEVEADLVAEVEVEAEAVVDLVEAEAGARVEAEVIKNPTKVEAEAGAEVQRELESMVVVAEAQRREVRAEARVKTGDLHHRRRIKTTRMARRENALPVPEAEVNHPKRMIRLTALCLCEQ